MTSDQQAVSGVRQRTRRAILDAAIATWARDFSASLGDIADRAEVSRSTLHRYYQDRQSLIDAALVAAITAVDEDTKKATSGSTTAIDQLEAMLRSMIDAGDAIIFLFSDPNRFTGNPNWSDEEDEEIPALIRRAQAEGAIAADVDPAWVINVFYSIGYVAAETINSGHLPRHRAADVAVRTFLHGLGAGP